MYIERCNWDRKSEKMGPKHEIQKRLRASSCDQYGPAGVKDAKQQAEGKSCPDGVCSQANLSLDHKPSCHARRQISCGGSILERI